jgi:alpha-beta hydrolase superfamily lysophospholipase
VRIVVRHWTSREWGLTSPSTAAATAPELQYELPKLTGETATAAAVPPVDRRPLYFGCEDRPLFGWLHRPAEGATGALGLVICNPFGNEAISIHRTIRQLADAAARAGIATLRFDYDGAGNSAGHDLDPDRLAAWVASVGLATDELRRVAGVDRVCLLGIRFGATLATLAAAGRTDVAGLIAIAPVVSGRAYVRELRMLSRATDSKRNLTRTANEDILETGGFLLSAQTQKSLGEIDLNKLEARPAERVLILDRAEMPGGESWERRLHSLGGHCERLSVSGYAEMMLDAHESVPPREITGAALHWMRELASSAQRTSTAQHLPAPSQPRVRLPHVLPEDPVGAVAPATTIEEMASCFGNPPRLFGIVSAPLAQRSGKAIILLNAGAVHHIGPNRLYVTLARQLVRSGHVVLRMDIAGIGDSIPRDGEPENVVYSQHAVPAIGEAIQYLRREWGASEVSAVGLCSGAYHAFKAAVARLPLAAVILINPLTFFWKEGMSLKYSEHRIAADMARYRSSTLRLSSWMKLLSGRVDLPELAQVLARRADAVARKQIRAIARLLRIQLRDDLPTELLSAVNKTDLQFVFAANDPGVELLRDQGGGTAQRLRVRNRIGVELLEGADHTFTDLAARMTLAKWVVEHLAKPVGRRTERDGS